MTMTEKQINYCEKYRKENIRQILVKVNKRTQPDLYDYIDTIENKQAYIIELITRDMISKQK